MERKDKDNNLVRYDSWKMSARSSSDFLIDEHLNIEELMKCLKFLSEKDLNLLYKIYVQCKTE